MSDGSFMRGIAAYVLWRMPLSAIWLAGLGLMLLAAIGLAALLDVIW